MNDSYIETVLIDAFLTLNEFSGVPYITKDANGNPLNVALPNKPFNPPNDNRYFVLSFLVNEPEPAGLGEHAKNRWDGIFQIDTFTPLGVGQEESNNKYQQIVKLFQRGKTFNEIMIKRTYRAMRGAEPASGFYRTVIRCEFTCCLPKD